MKNRLYLIVLTAFLAACSARTADKDLAAKKKELEESKAKVASLKESIANLEKEISEADPEFAKQHKKTVLVSTFVAEKKPFEHMVDVRGTVQSRRNVTLSSQAPGEIREVHVREGQQVSKGRVLVSLDADVIRHNISDLKTQLELATTVYEKQARLWDQKIGTEVQYLQAKANKESLERKLATANSQLEQMIIRAPFSGSIDALPARVGEMASPGVPLVRMVSPEQMYIKADVSERFIGRFKAGDKVEVLFPMMDKTIGSTIASVGQVINTDNRTFEVEIKLPSVDFTVKPNQVLVVKMRDYVSDDTFAVPTRIIQRDEDGEYIYAVVNRGEATTAQKIHVTTGINSGTQIEVVKGLKGNEVIVDRGYRDLSEGVEVSIASSDSTAQVDQN